MDYLHLKALHIIFVVSWFAGLFYLPRLIIYHTEANDKPEPDASILKKEYLKNEKLLFNAIMVPAMVLTVLTAIVMLYQVPTWLDQPWMQVKLGFVGVLIFYHFYCRKLLLLLKKDIYKHTSFQLRLFNEVATVILFAVVFLVVVKNNLDWIYAIGGLVIFAVLIMSAVRIVKNISKS